MMKQKEQLFIEHMIRTNPTSPRLRRARPVSQSLHKARKSLGQNFLMHTRIAERIALSAKLSPDSVVFEIGPGTGMLTRELLKLSGKIIALEADHELFETLQTDFANEIANGRLELVYGDIRSFDIAKLPKGYALVANIPYYLTGEIFRMFLTAEHQPSSMTLLVQKEVAERIARTKKESILSLSVKAFGTPKREFNVPRGAFHPAPKVDSAVLSIRDISRRQFATASEEERFFNLLHAGFAHKRKFVRKNLVEAGFGAGSIPEKARAEDLPLSAWLALMKV
ncbi:MAG: 16S rRNA (adenine(1518)-N(6)/adenine(1519)-N(6))-dimethyltransferase RsmA [Candidatus Pacebacteria bacterium]|nr:16S rRNA (adenine(1518)-N(6)/adenine(1519)-N(6))-dimethyltransferase RsmA [Candidatus Paceibacterota bacterium]